MFFFVKLAVSVKQLARFNCNGEPNRIRWCRIPAIRSDLVSWVSCTLALDPSLAMIV